MRPCFVYTENIAEPESTESIPATLQPRNQAVAIVESGNLERLGHNFLFFSNMRMCVRFLQLMSYQKVIQLMTMNMVPQLSRPGLSRRNG